MVRLALLFLCGCSLLGILQPVSASAKRRVCIDTDNETVVVRRRCNSPRYTEVTPSGVTAVTVERVSESFAIDLSSSGAFAGNSVSCPSGTYVTGGGVSVSDNNGLNIRRSIPLGVSGWTGSLEALQNNATGTMNVYAICSTGITETPEEEE